MRIHELEYEIDNPLNMQARTVDYNSWKEYIEKCAYPHYMKYGPTDWQESSNALVYDFIVFGENRNRLFRHHAYIMESWME